jgi:hypothetical protein
VRILKKILLGLVAVVVMVSIGAQFLPGTWQVRRSLLIQAPPAVLYPYLVDIRNWPQWNAFDAMDPAILHTYAGAASGVGSETTWISKKVGNGTARITAADPANGIGYEIQFEGTGDKAQGSISFAPRGTATQVNYVFGGQYGHEPLHRILGLFVDRFLGPAFEQSLAKLKTLAENKTSAIPPR